MELFFIILGGVAAVVAIPAGAVAVLDYVAKLRKKPGSGILKRLADARGHLPKRILLPSPISPQIPEGQASRVARIVAQSGTTADAFEAWQAHLRRSMLFPFEATMDGTLDAFGADLIVLVRRLLGKTENWDVIVQIISGGEVVEVGLSALRPTDHASPQFQLTMDYQAWRKSLGNLDK